jgi:hypothetical protein
MSDAVCLASKLGNFTHLIDELVGSGENKVSRTLSRHVLFLHPRMALAGPEINSNRLSCLTLGSVLVRSHFKLDGHEGFIVVTVD